MFTEKNTLFPHRELMIRGSLGECYYCGSHRHDLKECPSKNLHLPSMALAKLGYLSIDRLSDCFARVFGTPEDYDQHLANLKASDLQTISSENETLAAYHAFFNLTEIFQLRFLKQVWQTGASAWSMLAAAEERKGEGGPLWLALDCIRVGQTGQAEQLLRTAQDKQVDSYKLHVATGFLELERKNQLEALYQFERARECTHNRLRQIHALFLIARLHEVRNDYDKAEEKVHDIICLDRDCLEAQYYKLVLEAKRTLSDKGLVKLQRIISQQPEFFLYALIDPRVLPVQELVDSLLAEMLEGVQKEAEDMVQKAEAKVKAMAEWLEEDEEMYRESKRLAEKAGQLTAQASYLGCTEAKDIAASLIQKYHLTEKTLKINLLKQIAFLENQLKRYETYWKRYPLKGFFKAVGPLLGETRQRLNYAVDLAKTDKASIFKEARKVAEETASEIEQMAVTVGRMVSWENGFNVARSFGKYLFILEVIALVVALFVIPIGSSVLTHLYPGLDWAVFDDTGQYHKKCFGICGVAGFLAAIVLTLKKTSRF
ncbi:MAG: hypothetical protein AB1487_00810 [Thermodesulfobacteriota bacterium]